MEIVESDKNRCYCYANALREKLVCAISGALEKSRHYNSKGIVTACAKLDDARVYAQRLPLAAGVGFRFTVSVYLDYRKRERSEETFRMSIDAPVEKISESDQLSTFVNLFNTTMAIFMDCGGIASSTITGELIAFHRANHNGLTVEQRTIVARLVRQMINNAGELIETNVTQRSGHSVGGAMLETGQPMFLHLNKDSQSFTVEIITPMISSDGNLASATITFCISASSGEILSWCFPNSELFILLAEMAYLASTKENAAPVKP